MKRNLKIIVFIILAISIVAVIYNLVLKSEPVEETTESDFYIPNTKKTNFDEIGSIINCAQNANDLSYDSNCWMFQYEYEKDAVIAELLVFTEDSKCIFDETYQPCTSKEVEIFYNENYGTTIERVKGFRYDADNNPQSPNYFIKIHEISILVKRM